ncbi:MAG: CarD family transcriptional regulator, partial [Clostridia bacterium]|nr:CarD family transcriptional regulator [Clostridia bacterium]
MFDFLSAIKTAKIESYMQNIKSGTKQVVSGLSSSDKGLFLGLAGKGSIFVAKDLVSSGKIAEQLLAFDLKTQFITGPYENAMGLKDTFLSYDFLSIVSNFVRKKIDILIVTVDALFQKVPTKKSLQENILKLEKNKDYDFKTLAQIFVKMGYTRSDFVSNRGQFSIRGDILLVCPINFDEIIKIEFFDTKLEKIAKISFDERKFVEELESVEIVAIDYQEQEENLLNFADKIFFDEPKQLEDLAKNFDWAENFVAPNKIFESKAKSQTAFASLDAKSFFKLKEIINFQKLATKKYIFDLKELLIDLEYFKNSGKTVYLFCQDQTKKERIDNFLEQNFVFVDTIKETDKFIYTLKDFLPYSISFLDSKSVFIGTYDLFKKEKPKITNSKTVLYVPKIGEYVVHNIHGIGKCVGLEKLKFSDYEKDYFIIEYANGDRLYLPTEQTDTISAFYAGEKEPKLNKLGGVE